MFGNLFIKKNIGKITGKPFIYGLAQGSIFISISIPEFFINQMVQFMRQPFFQGIKNIQRSIVDLKSKLLRITATKTNSCNGREKQAYLCAGLKRNQSVEFIKVGF